MDKMQEEFDKAFGVVFEKIEMLPDIAENTRNVMLQIYSVGWYDSRAALVVELPIAKSTNYCNEMSVRESEGYNECLTEVAERLKEAGIKYE